MVGELRSFTSSRSRRPTAYERKQHQALEEAGLVDVYLSTADAPDAFWNALQQASYTKIAGKVALERGYATRWWNEFRWQHGWAEAASDRDAAQIFDKILLTGGHAKIPDEATPELRFAAIENLLDVVRPPSRSEFESAANEAAQRFRVGVRIEDSRFVDMTSDEVHREIVRPALALLADDRLADVDALYRKGFERLLDGDPAGAITAATSAVQQILVAGGASGSRLQPLAHSARAMGWIGPGEEQQIAKLEAFRGDADAHRVGTEDPGLARLVLHLSASLLLYLGRTIPDPDRDN